MKLLLDTHIWLWSQLHPAKLSARVRRAIGKADAELYLSPVSIWEASHLARRGVLRTEGTFSAWLDRALAAAPVREAPFDFAVAREASLLHLPQGDPGDTFLAATAIAHDLVLVTGDEQLLECCAVRTLANR